MPRVTQAHLDARRDQILDAAVTCFSRDGLHRATMEDVVRESSLSAGAIYNYFESKEEIVRAIATERQARERKLIAAAELRSSLADVVDGLRDAFFAPLKDPKERRRRRVSIQLWAEAQRNRRILTIVRRGVDGPRRLLTSFITKAQHSGAAPRDVDPDAAARLMIAVYLGFVLQLEWDQGAAVEPYVELLNLCVRRVLASAPQR